MAEISASGISITTLLEYLEQIQQGHLDIDPSWNIDPESPDGQRIASEAEMFANLDEQILLAYQSVDPNSAIGQQLNRLAAISGLQRQAATFSTATVTFSGVEDTVIPAGTLVRNKTTDTLWATDTEAVIEYGVADVNVTCQTAGAQLASIGDLSIIDTPIGGVSSVTNTEVASLGTEEEADAVFRVRRNLSVSKPGDNQVDSIFALVANIDGVKKVRVIENFSSVADANGVEPHSIVIFVDGGDPDDIAAAIADGKSPGCGLNADNAYANKVQVATATPKGSPFTATFYRPVLTTIYVDIVLGGGPFSDEKKAAIKQAVVDFANATLFETEGTGFDRTGFDIGDIIAAGKLFTPVNKVVGDLGYTVSILIGDDDQDITHNTIDPGFNGLGVFSVDNISVA